MILRWNYIVLLYCVFFLAQQKGYTQDNDIRIANEYFDNGEYEKAKDFYERLSKNTQNLPSIYDNYLSCLMHLKQYAEAEKLSKRMAKQSPDNLTYRIDHYLIMCIVNGEEKSEKEFSAIVSDIKNNPVQVEKAADYLKRAGKEEKSAQLYLASRKALNDRSLYTLNLASIYYNTGKKDWMIDELLEFSKNYPDQLDNIKNTFQSAFKDDKDYDLLENKLYEQIQKDANDVACNELLLWLNIQKKNFSKAFIQAKALDKRYKTQGEKLMEVGRIAMENKDYESAINFFQHITKEYSNGRYYEQARKELIRSKEEIVKNSFPVDLNKIKSLISDYKSMINDLGTNNATLEARRSMALLYAFYLDQKDTAILLLNEVIQLARYDPRLKAKAKIDMADIYLLKNEPWESTLLYSQVEKDFKEDPIGHEAKLRNAKLSYYKGDFELAQEHLDVLKLATSREIANDAMDLSILIQDNIGIDTTTEALKQYASIDLLLFQNKISEALYQCDQMIAKYASNSIIDEVYFLKAKLLRKIGAYDSSLAALNKIIVFYPYDILGDDALFMMGNIYEENLKNYTKAMEIYQKFLTTYPGSIYTVEARKKFRLLRGDKL
ncbi:MAG: tetratricopeptide repeat protein [Cytophagaceae bacterium]|nr:tetratricopeptide repeat protein [Cytophagaceae bacterium]MDW8455227.1 tetratricopeptide repeat protein [Cytophagaceae bacterium]